jgi:hypothetical protein
VSDTRPSMHAALAGIRDFRYARYVTEGATIQPLD